MSSPDRVAAIPYRQTDESLDVLLITSRTQGRWILPKGQIESHLGLRESARQEAYEEAGVRGTLATDPIGRYTHCHSDRTYEVLVYPMLVTEVLSKWPEAHERKRRWTPLERAIERIDEADLGTLLRSLPEWLSHPSLLP